MNGKATPQPWNTGRRTQGTAASAELYAVLVADARRGLNGADLVGAVPVRSGGRPVARCALDRAGTSAELNAVPQMLRIWRKKLRFAL